MLGTDDLWKERLRQQREWALVSGLKYALAELDRLGEEIKRQRQNIVLHLELAGME